MGKKIWAKWESGLTTVQLRWDPPVVCKHAKLTSLVTSIALQQIKGTDMTFDQDMIKDIHCTCKIQWYAIDMLLLILLGIIFSISTKGRKLRLFGDTCSLM